jgi:hypothetical protein
MSHVSRGENVNTSKFVSAAFIGYVPYDSGWVENPEVLRVLATTITHKHSSSVSTLVNALSLS